MRHCIPRILLMLAVLSGLSLAGPQPSLWSANLSTDYTGVPPYVSNVVTPNILMLLDNSESMRVRAYCDPNGCPPLPDGNVDIAPEWKDLFDPATRYTGYFNPMRCYTYRNGTWNNDTTDATNRFADGGDKTPKQVLQGICSDTQWDGNLLNWIVFRRIDALKKALTGGECAAGRNSDGTCQSLAGKITIQSHRGPNLLSEYMNLSTTASTGDQITGRLPASYRYATVLSIHLRQSGSYGGWFCINDNYDWIYGSEDGGRPCSAASVITGYSVVKHYDEDYISNAGWYCDYYVEGICANWTYYAGLRTIKAAGPDTLEANYSYDDNGDSTAAGFNIRLALDAQPGGVIQQIGNQARLGLMAFQPRNSGLDGSLVTVGIGARQSTVQVTPARTTNAAAMIDGIDAISAQSTTPLAESLYEAARYIAQLPPTFDTKSYSYPLAFGSAAGFGQAGVGSIGNGELNALVKGETCPADYITDACGRDPYFFGMNYTPAWASPSAVVPCCKTFVLIVTDGAPTWDDQVPSQLQGFASKVHGKKCNGSDKNSKHRADGVCNGMADTSPSDLLLEHKEDYPGGSHYLDDVALWAHTTDLRQITVPGIKEAGHDLPGMQNLTLYAVYAFGSISGREILMQAARQGGYDYDPSKPKTLSDLALQDCTNPDGSTGQSNLEWDKLNNATGAGGPDCIPDNYFESSNTDDIRDRLFAAITKFFETTSSSAAVSVLASSSTGEGISYQAFFYQTKTEIADSGIPNKLTWLGYLQGFFVDTFGNLREDSDPDGKLKLQDSNTIKGDHIIKLRFDEFNNKTVADRYHDSNGTGMADPTPFQTDIDLSTLKPVWEAGRQLALTDAGASCTADTAGVTCRRILTWIDGANPLTDGKQIEFAADSVSVATLCPYLGGNDVSSCAGGAGQTEALGIINFVRGCDPAQCSEQATLRNRTRKVSGTSLNKVWKLGDIMASTPVVLGAPPERYDVIYGDGDYAKFYQRYRDRRQVVYTGANDGMLHAFNGGFLSVGVTAKKERLRFLTSPREPASDKPCTKLPCDDPAYALRSNDPSLGAELWAFIPQDLLPQLRWLTDLNYSHTYYVDLKPKITDVRIFTPDADHPGGWGTILIGGFRFGGSCSNCTYGKGGARTVTADFGGGTSTRAFLSAYFVLDITNPEKDPVVLWTFRDQDLGLTTALPTVVRVNPVPGTDSSNEKWYAVFGTGMTHYDGSSGQTAQIFVVDLKLGPTYSAMNVVTGNVRGKDCTVSPCIAADTLTNVGLFSTNQKGFMGDAVSLDANLDFRVDVIYLGSTFCNKNKSSDSDGPCKSKAGGPVWKGTMWRISTNAGDTDLTAWGVSGAPTQLISSFTPSPASCPNSKANTPCSTVIGPITAAPTITVDKGEAFWVFFGTGRLIDYLDKPNADPQNFFGVKDCTITNSCPSLPDGSLPDETVERHYLLDVSRAKICTSQCVDPEKTVSRDGTNFTEDTDAFISDIQARDGWVTTLLAGERSLSKAALLGGTLFFSTFSPDDSLCDFSGEGRLYGLYYLTGTGYNASTLGATTNGKGGATGGQQIANAYVELGSGLPSQVALQIGGLGEGLSGVATAGRGCVGGITTNMQMSNATIAQVCTGTGPAYSRVIAWRDL
jgi:type IV pilus assembly protein PilY1